jgi:hypothetical protein
MLDRKKSISKSLRLQTDLGLRPGEHETKLVKGKVPVVN